MHDPFLVLVSIGLVALLLRLARWSQRERPLPRLMFRKLLHALIGAVKDKSPEVRRRVINALGEIGDARALDALTLALKDEDAAIRRSAAMAIAEIGGGSGPLPHPHPHPSSPHVISQGFGGASPRPSPNPRVSFQMQGLMQLHTAAHLQTVLR